MPLAVFLSFSNNQIFFYRHLSRNYQCKVLLENIWADSIFSLASDGVIDSRGIVPICNGKRALVVRVSPVQSHIAESSHTGLSAFCHWWLESIHFFSNNFTRKSLKVVSELNCMFHIGEEKPSDIQYFSDSLIKTVQIETTFINDESDSKFSIFQLHIYIFLNLSCIQT